MLEDSTWFKSPSPLDRVSIFPATAWYFRTDSRDRYEKGTSRAKHIVTFDTDDAGNLEGKATVVFENDPTYAVRRYFGTLSGIEGVIKGAKAQFATSSSVDDYWPGFNTRITGSASGNDPLAVGAPYLDYDFVIEIRKCRGFNPDGAEGTAVSLVFTHDKFPDYEVLVDGAGEYHFRGKTDFLAGGWGLMNTDGNHSIDLGVY